MGLFPGIFDCLTTVLTIFYHSAWGKQTPKIVVLNPLHYPFLLISFCCASTSVV